MRDRRALMTVRAGGVETHFAGRALLASLQDRRMIAVEPIDLEPRYTDSQLPGRCLKCLAEQRLDGCLRQLLTQEGEDPELVQKYSALLSFLQSEDSAELRDQAERILAQGKSVTVRVCSDGDKTTYILQVDEHNTKGGN